LQLKHNTYGKGRVRVMRVKRDAPRHEVRELSLLVLLEGDFAVCYTNADNTTVIATDSIKNIVNINARHHPELDTEAFLPVLATYFLSHYAQVAAVSITAHETKWQRLTINGAPHDHAFALDANGRNTVRLHATREGQTLHSGVEDFTFLKSTESGWANFVIDDATTLPETHDRIFSTAMNASWLWSGTPESFPETNGRVLEAMLNVFATTYSPSVQNTLYLMGVAALEAVTEIAEISLACPNKHYIPINLAPFRLDNPNAVFLPTDEPHGQIECTVAR